MSRALSAEMLSAIAANTLRPVLIAKITTTSGSARLWTGIGDLQFESETYTGVGHFGGVSNVQESSYLQANGITFSLSGVPSAYLSMALGQIQYGRPAILWFGLVDVATGLLVNSPYKIFSGLTDVPAINEGPDTSEVLISAESRLADLERPRVRRYTHEDQQIDHPGDRGFEYVTALQDMEIEWI